MEVESCVHAYRLDLSEAGDCLVKGVRGVEPADLRRAKRATSHVEGEIWAEVMIREVQRSGYSKDRNRAREEVKDGPN